MIITEKIKIKVNSKKIKYFKSIGYDNVKKGIEIEIPIVHLSESSHYKILVKCDICSKEKYLMYYAYRSNISKYGYYSCSHKCASNKNKLTKLEKYGDKNYVNVEKCKQTKLKKYDNENYNNSTKNKETCLKNYGVDNPSQSDIIQKLKTKNYFSKHGFMPIEKTDLDRYRCKVKNLTNKNKKELLKNWNGHDFYDNEYIKDNFNLSVYNKKYPTIDHKISVFYGFINNLPPEEISKIDNLCFTKRTLNIKKHKKCYEGEEES